MAEPSPQDLADNGSGDGGEAVTLATATATATTHSKRQRRPSVRLGDIGDPNPSSSSNPHPVEPFPRRPKLSHPSQHPQLLRARVLTIDAATDRALLPVDENLSPLARRGGLSKPRGRPASSGRRARSARASNPNDAHGAESKSSGGEDAGDEGLGLGFSNQQPEELRREDSLSPDRLTLPPAAVARVRILDDRDMAIPHNADAGCPSEMDGGGDWDKQEGECRLLEERGIRSWLDGLGLGRYAPVFEIHEVDDEVLPLLTLEDLKDMGINAVGSRRKLYSAIQKIGKA